MTNKGTTTRVGEHIPGPGAGLPAGEFLSASGEATTEELAQFAAWEAELRTEAGDPDGPEFEALLRGMDEALAAQGEQGWVDPGQELMGGLAAAARGLERAAVDGDDLVR
ncbi:MAG: hypothetical protein GX555_04875, partial [Actinomycetales bacterium]|nr:hypothetical protein [Actinomycetales bacterium]